MKVVFYIAWLLLILIIAALLFLATALLLGDLKGTVPFDLACLVVILFIFMQSYLQRKVLQRLFPNEAGSFYRRVVISTVILTPLILFVTLFIYLVIIGRQGAFE